VTVLQIAELKGISAANLIDNSGQFAGQDVFHFHMQIIPRREGDRLHPKDWLFSKGRTAEVFGREVQTQYQQQTTRSHLP
jgi:diadenosine tetraphosphate (Ap4A) HIT family hydrolase